MSKMNIQPGEYHFADTEIVFNEGKQHTTITMENMGDRPIQIGSHFHLYEVNSSIKFYDESGKEDIDRNIVWGKRFDIPSGTSVRFEPSEKKKVNIIPIAGKREVWGLNNLCDGSVDVAPKTPYSKVPSDKSWK